MNPGRGYLTGMRRAATAFNNTARQGEGKKERWGIQTFEERERERDSWSLAHFWINSRLTHIVFLLAHFWFYHSIDKQDQGPAVVPDNPLCTHTYKEHQHENGEKMRRINKSIIDDKCSKINQCLRQWGERVQTKWERALLVVKAFWIHGNVSINKRRENQ